MKKIRARSRAGILTDILGTYLVEEDADLALALTMQALQEQGVEVLPVWGGEPGNPQHEKRITQKQPALGYSAKATYPTVSTEAELEELLDKMIRGGVCAYGIKPNEQLIVIDADTPEEVQGLHTFLTQCGVEDWQFTVQTPGLGELDENGERKHREGGHLYITVPEGVLYGVKGRKAHARGFSIYGPGNHYLLGTGSTRAGTGTSGWYELVGEVLSGEDYPELVMGIREALTTTHTPTHPPAHTDNIKSTPRAERVYKDSSHTEQRFRDWSIDTPWSSLLSRLGLVHAGFSQVPGCGASCISVRHERGSSAIGGTAHEVDCPVVSGTTTGLLWAHSDTMRSSMPQVPWKGQGEVSATKWQVVLHTLYSGDVAFAFASEPDLQESERGWK